MRPFLQLSCFLIGLVPIAVSGQTPLTMDDAVKAALRNNLLLQSGQYHVQSMQAMRRTSTEIGKTSLMWMGGQYNSVYKDNNFTISQSIPFPTVLASQSKLNEAQATGAALNLEVSKNTLVYEVQSAYQQLSYHITLRELLFSQDSIYSRFAIAAGARYKAGEGTLLEKMTAETQRNEIQNTFRQNESDIEIYQEQLKTLLNVTEDFELPQGLSALERPMDPTTTMNPQLRYLAQQTTIAQRTKSLERNRLLPDIGIGFYSQSLTGYQTINNQEVFFDRHHQFTGFELGLSFPLWFVPQVARAKAYALQQAGAEKEQAYFQQRLSGQLLQGNREIDKYQHSLEYFSESALVNANLIISQAKKSFESGEIGYVEYLQALKAGYSIKSGYLSALNDFNQAVIKLHYLIGQ